jgi:hypothetical protein
MKLNALRSGIVASLQGAARRAGAGGQDYASSRLEVAGKAKPARGAAAVLGAIGAAVMFALTWLAGGHFPKS